ncbi:hypothetical protein PoB_007222900 [Plakobranchus ocellatus]|uniref:Uncharacterized protein n=1 Tax=Plakobranchus ocellatus TaxID=259542 RepID=A0AAV4DNI5_9GAST|nr:hypothetical protein PoB_007222900 [Plakobranchus ocellatus]
MLKKREEKLFERLVIGQGSQLVSYANANQRLKGLKFADCLVYRKVTFSVTDDEKILCSTFHIANRDGLAKRNRPLDGEMAILLGEEAGAGKGAGERIIGRDGEEWNKNMGRMKRESQRLN